MKLFRKTGVSTLMNVVGMGIALAVFMILMVQVRWDTTYDKNFEGHEQVFRMEHNWIDQGLFSTYFSRPIIEMARDASPNIEAVGTMMRLGNEIYYREGNKESAITIPAVLVDSTMLSVFPFEWVEGSAKNFTAKGTAVLNEAFAQMIFGNESAVGKILETGAGDRCQIVGVFKNNPRNFSMHYGIMENMGNQWLTSGDEWSFPQFLKLRDPSQAKETEDAIMDVVLSYFGENIDESSRDEDAGNELRKGFRISNLHKAHFERDVRANEGSANKSITVTLAFIAVLLILIAIINFINFAFAEIPFHIKNINTRKVLGESRCSLVMRQLCHAALLAILAFSVGVGIMHLASGISVATFISDSIRVTDNLGLLAVTLGIALVSATIAGIAPALYSTAQPAALVLKGRGSFATTAQGKLLRNLSIAVQFVLSFVFIIFALYANVQTRFLMDKDMGFYQENVLQVWCGQKAGAQKDALQDKLLQNPAIEAVTFCDNHIVSDQKMGWGRTGDDGKQIYMEVLPVADNFVEFFGLQIVEGRDFLESDDQSYAGCFIANETFIQKFPHYHVGSFMGGHVDNAEIVGIVKDFNFKSLQHPMEPLVLLNWGKTSWRSFGTVYIRMSPGVDFKDVSRYIQESVCAFDPTRTPDQVAVRHLDEWIENMYNKEQSLGNLVSIASVVALFIAIIGILGLVFFETQFMKKEIAVRRVNGATIESILQMINKKYLAMAGISFLVSAPVVWWLISVWKRGFAYQAPVSVWIFLAALLLVEVVTFAVVTLQSWRAASANPVESLKSE